ncbi:MAG: class I SAM-dependent rRNA methyltransferase [Verrucomicrobia bacterium]|nr:class I SAM-dependent rRNA methyltransferase [Verrucomicrobiota bacterium]MDA1064994.1 class I SAM-dependent rRNA methyltransferase [Verrucomicrobiota bacterium]
MKSIFLKPRSRSRALNGHPWVFAGEVQDLLPESENGKTVILRDSRKHILGSGIYNLNSQIIWRRYSWERTAFSMPFIRETLTRAVQSRPDESCRRLVWSESDSLPGLVVDQFGKVLVIQALTLAIDMRLPAIATFLQELTGAETVVFRNDAQVRKLEGLETYIGTFEDKELNPFDFDIGGIIYRLDLLGGQKTGFYLDQREQHALVASYASGRTVLDAFCNQGAFALQCAKAGAVSVIGIDSSETAVVAATQNAEANGLDAQFNQANVFDYFSENRESTFDLIVLDPPPFARTQAQVEGGLKGYKEINLRALKSLNKGGILATYTCSQAISQELFKEVLAAAASDARRSVRILHTTYQAADHPVLLNMPESGYLRGYILQVD